jgi:hypothetical protein
MILLFNFNEQTLGTMLIGAAIFFWIVNWMYWRYQGKELFFYTVVASQKFQISKEFYKFYIVVFSNTSDVVDYKEKINYHIKVEHGKIHDIKVFAADVVEEKINIPINDTMTFASNFLNHNTKIECLIIVKEEKDSTSKLQSVDAQGSGIKAKENSAPKERGTLVRYICLLVLGAGLALIFSSFNVK